MTFSSSAFSGPIAAVASATRSAFEKEQKLSPAQLMDRWAPFIKEASRRFGVAETWIRAVMRLESGGRTALDDKKPITSHAGAMGIMQVMPETYQEMRRQHGLGADPNDPHDNVLAGTAYLSWLYGKYGYPKLFAAYNAGPGTVEAQAAGARKFRMRRGPMSAASPASSARHQSASARRQSRLSPSSRSQR